MTNAWNDIINKDGSDEWLVLCNAALREIQTETSRRNARRILAENPDRSPEFSDGAEWASDLIHPDTDQ